MDNKKNIMEKWTETVGDLLSSYRELVTIKVAESGSLGVSIGIIGMVVLVISVFILLFLGLGFAWWIGEVLSNMKAGFFIVGVIYALVLLVILLTVQKFWIPRLRDVLIKKFYESN
jgi:hypothetical protein